MKNNHLNILILAAGKGTRMKSATPKVLHKLCGTPMIIRVLRTVFALKPANVAVVVGSGGGEVIEEIKKAAQDHKFPAPGSKSFQFIRQKELKGSGHAVQTASRWIKQLPSGSDLLILCGDTPLISKDALQSLIRTHQNEKNSSTICTMTPPDPFAYGRIARDESRHISRIVEEKDASPAEKAIREVNTGIYCFDTHKLLPALSKLTNKNAKKEYYLTDTIETCYRMGWPVGSYCLGGEGFQAMGINSRADLAEAETYLQQKVLRHWMEEGGVTIVNPLNTYIEDQVVLGPETVILPGTMLLGRTRIGRNCAIGPNTYLKNTTVGNDVSIRTSFLYGCTVKDEAQIGPFTHLRQGAVIGPEARIGNFSEIKNSTIGRDTKVSHLAYIGDAVLGEKINIGAGVITCNFDGKKKHKTVIGSNSFIGSNVNLVAPVRIGSGVVIGAGSTINKNVPNDSLALARAHQINKKDWVKVKRSKGG